MVRESNTTTAAPMKKVKCGKLDQLFVKASEAGSYSYIHAVLTFDACVDDTFIKKRMEAMIKFSRYRSYLDNDGYWKEVPTTIDGHTTITDCGGAAAADDAYLKQYVCDVALTPFAAKKSPWEVHILHYGQEDRTDLVFRIHHCMGDGMTLSAVMMDMMDSEDGDEGVPLTARTKKPRKPCGAQTLSYLKFFLHCFVSFWVSLFKLLSVLFYVNDTPTLVNAVEKRAHKLSLGLSRPISVAELKLAGKNITEANRKKNKNQSTTSKVSINDILTSCLGGGIRRYLKKKNCPSIEKKVLRLTSFIIVSTRMVASGGDNQKLIEDFAQNKSDNQFTYVFMPLAADEASPIERVNKSNQIMSYLKKSLEPVIAQFTNELTMQLCGFPAVFWMTNRFQRANTAIMSNLRGPRVPLRVGKYRMTRLFNFVTPMGMAMCCSFFSYAGNVYLAVDTDSGVIPDAQELVDCIVEEYEAVVAKAK